MQKPEKRDDAQQSELVKTSESESSDRRCSGE